MPNSPKQNQGLLPRHPRPYLSWSALHHWETSPDEFVNHYIYGHPEITNPAMQLGQKFATMLETDQEQDDTELEHYRTFLPKYPKKEFDIRAEIAGVPILGKLDGFDPERLWIGEYKTGRSWTQKRAHLHRQLDFYALLVLKAYGSLPKRITLHWIPTITGEDGMPQPSGEIVNFETYRKLDNCIQIGGDIKRAWDEIGIRCAIEYRDIGL